MYAPFLAKLRASPVRKNPAPKFLFQHRNVAFGALEECGAVVSFCADDVASFLPGFPDYVLRHVQMRHLSVSVQKVRTHIRHQNLNQIVKEQMRREFSRDSQKLVR